MHEPSRYLLQMRATVLNGVYVIGDDVIGWLPAVRLPLLYMIAIDCVYYICLLFFYCVYYHFVNLRFCVYDRYLTQSLFLF